MPSSCSPMPSKASSSTTNPNLILNRSRPISPFLDKSALGLPSSTTFPPFMGLALPSTSAISAFPSSLLSFSGHSLSV
jgi:hypothetical protein